MRVRMWVVSVLLEDVVLFFIFSLRYLFFLDISLSAFLTETVKEGQPTDNYT